MSKHKTNPRNQPRTEADVRRARKQGQDEGSEVCLNVISLLLKDKFGFSHDQQAMLVYAFNTYMASIADGSIKYQQVKDALAEEYEVIVEVK